MCKTNMFVNSKEKEYEEEVLELQPGAAPLLFPLSFPAAIHRFLWYLSHSHTAVGQSPYMQSEIQCNFT